MISDENIDPQQPGKRLFWDFWRQARSGPASVTDRLWQQASLRRRQVPAEKKQRALVDLRHRLQQQRAAERAPLPGRRLGWGLRVAASFIGLALAAAVLWHLSPYRASQTYTTGFGQIRQVTLPDRSVVSLNANSTLRYRRDWQRPDGLREVWLEGEAFFVVAKNARKPFVIHLKHSQIRVLGTSFNVRAFDKEPVETSVLTGKVAFIPKQGLLTRTRQDTLLLLPNRKGIFSSHTGQLRQEPTNSRDDKAWAEGKLIFRATPLGDIARILERTYGTRFRFVNPALKQCRITASFEQNSLEEVVHLLSLTVDYQYRIAAGMVVIEGPGCAQPRMEEMNR